MQIGDDVFDDRPSRRGYFGRFIQGIGLERTLYPWINLKYAQKRHHQKNLLQEIRRGANLFRKSVMMWQTSIKD